MRGEIWGDTSTRAPAWLDSGEADDPLEPAQVAGLYRALRKAREEDGDEAGAGDLYYGEMEMRRISSAAAEGSRSKRDRALLWSYWAISGYGLRPTRALVSLAVTLLIGAALLFVFGFQDERNYGRSLLFAVQSSLSLLRPPETSLTAGGEVVQIALRLLGPLLFGLALLAVRTRVKR